MTRVTRAAELADGPARHSIEYRLDSTLFVEAGAGSGKTTALVSRIVQLLKSGACELDELAAITFTEAAALELRLRVRTSLMDLARRGRDGPERQRVLEALDHLDEAAISTIHGFCQRLLAEYPIEAGLPPRIEILDEVRQSLAWREHWSAVLDQLGADADMRMLFGVAADIGVTPKHLQDLAREVGEEWDRCGRVDPDVTSVLASVTLAIEQGAAAVRASLDRALDLAGCCTDLGDGLLTRLREAQEYGDLLDEAGLQAGLPAGFQAGDAGGDPRLAVLAARRPSFRVANAGQRDSWTCDVDDVRGHLNDVRIAREIAVGKVADLVLPALVATFDVVARKAATERRVQGQLVFHDLLVLARDLLAHNPEVLASVRRRLRFLLIDEFQDTDPLQLEIAELIGGRRPARAGEAAAFDAASSGVEAGRLFFVGDPKQSIYRFRGADLAAYEVARARLAEDGPLALTSNFRSVPGILEFANECFGTLMGESYSRLEPVRPADGTESPVRLVGRALADGLRRHDQRVIESEACAAIIDRAVRTEGWLVSDGTAGETLRSPRLSDVAILVPRRTGLAELEAALDAHGIGYRVESASLVYRSQEVRDLLALCRAIDDPSDQVALLAALRSPAFACRDDELYEFRRGGGTWSIEPLPETDDAELRVSDCDGSGLPADDTPTPAAEASIRAGDTPTPAGHVPTPAGETAASGLVVAEALRKLRGYRARRFELGPVGLLSEAVRDRRLLQLAAGTPRARESWRRVRFLIERLRAFVEAGGGGLREFADWVDEQLSEGLRSVESVLPEPDEDVVHILTVHAAKGLEYPIAVLAGFGTSDDVPRGVGPKVLRSADGKVEVRFRVDLTTTGFGALKTSEQTLELEEAVRVLYVAATRARDHLIVCAHHLPATGDPTLGQRLYEAASEASQRVPGLWQAIDGDGAVEESTEHKPSGPQPTTPVPSVRVPVIQGSLFDVSDVGASEGVVAQRVMRRPASSPEEWQAWQRDREELLARVRRRRSVRATEVAALAGLGWSRTTGPATGGAATGPAIASDAGPAPGATASAAGPATAQAADSGSDSEIEELAPRRRGRGGTQLGRAVHATLQAVAAEIARQIANGEPAGPQLGRLAGAEARAERIGERAGEVEQLAAAALSSPTVRAAFASGRPRREVYVATTIGDVVLEGYVDLCFEDDGELIVVDYKTDVLHDEAEVAAAAERYRLQAAAYALALHEATGLPVRRCVFVFLSPPGRPIEFEVPDLATALLTVRSVVGAS